MNRLNFYFGPMLLFLLSSGCRHDPEYDRLTIEGVGSNLQISRQPSPSGSLRISAGYADAFGVTIESKTDDFPDFTPVVLSSKDEQIFRVLPSAATPNYKFVIWGVGKGRTCMQVTLNDKEVECIPVTVE